MRASYHASQGTDLAPTALREAGLSGALARIGWGWDDRGDIDFASHFRAMRVGKGSYEDENYQHSIEVSVATPAPLERMSAGKAKSPTLFSMDWNCAENDARLPFPLHRGRAVFFVLVSPPITIPPSPWKYFSQPFSSVTCVLTTLPLPPPLTLHW